MDKQLWTGVLLGVAATILVFGGIAAVGATAMGMGGNGMMTDGMMDECQQRMMQDHGHGHDGGQGHDHGETNGTNGTNTSGGDGGSPHAVALTNVR